MANENKGGGQPPQNQGQASPTNPPPPAGVQAQGAPNPGQPAGPPPAINPASAVKGPEESKGPEHPPGRPNAAPVGANPNPLGIPPGAAGLTQGPPILPPKGASDRSDEAARPMGPKIPRGALRREGDRAASATQFQKIDPTQLAATMVSVQKALEQQQASQLPTPGIDLTAPGGHFIVDERHVNAWGQEIDDPRESEDHPEYGSDEPEE